MLDIFQELAEELLNILTLHPPRRKHESAEMHGEVAAMHYLTCHPDALPSEISEALCVTTARIAVTLRRLESKEFITRSIDKSDRRRIFVNLTQKGRETAKEYHNQRLKHFAETLELLGEHDAREHVRIIKRMTEVKSKC